MRENPIKMDDLGLPVMEPPPHFFHGKVDRAPRLPRSCSHGQSSAWPPADRGLGHSHPSIGYV